MFKLVLTEKVARTSILSFEFWLHQARLAYHSVVDKHRLAFFAKTQNIKSRHGGTFSVRTKLFLVFLFLPTLALARIPKELQFQKLQWTPPPVQRQILSNGTTVFMLPDAELPLVEIRGTIRTGTMYEPLDQIGVGSLCVSTLRTGGTQSRTAKEIDEALEFVGASIGTEIDTESASIHLSVLKKDLDQGLELFADILMNPVFRKQSLSVEKAKMIEGIRRRNDDAFQIARREFRKLLYGNDHPLSRVPEIPQIKKISRKDLKKFYQKYYHPNNLMLAISGDFDPDSMIQKLEGVFKNWEPSRIAFPAVPGVQKSEGVAPKRTIGLVDKPLTQSSILLGHLGVKRHNQDRFVLEVLNEILGGNSFTSRLYKEIRSREGFAYWVGSSFSEPWDYGMIAAGCQTRNETAAQAIKAIVRELERMREEKVLEKELLLAQETIINSFVFRYASSQAIVTQKMVLEYYGYPSDYLETYTQKIAAVTVDQIQAAAQKYLKPDQLTFTIVGDPKKWNMDFSQLGDVKALDIKIKE